MASDPGRVVRFGRTERTLHWAHAIAFVALLISGAFLYLPALATILGDRPLVKGVHVAVAIAWLVALALIALLGNRRALRRTWRQFEHLERDDLRWLRSSAARAALAQPRFNAGQRAHGLAQGVLSILFVVSGALLLLGERHNALRLDGALPLHDMATVVAVVLVSGHVWMALAPPTNAALRGMLDGTVSAAYASDHHAAWDPDAEPPPAGRRVGPLQAIGAALAVAAGVAVAVALL